MALLRLESFDYYGLDQEAKMADNDWVVQGDLQNTHVRTGTLANNCGWHSGGFWGSSAAWLVGKTLTDLIVGYACWYDTLPSGVNADSGVITQIAGGRLICGVAVNSDGTVSVWRNDQVSGTGPGGAVWTFIAKSDVGDTRVVTGTWNYIEVKFLGGTDEIYVRINNQDVLYLAPGNSLYHQGNTISRVIYDAGNDSNGSFYMDDLYMCDLSVGDVNNPCNDWLGDVRVFTLSPNGTGVSTQWTPVGSTPNWSCVDEVPTDDDSTYVQGTAVGLVDSYQFSDLDPTVTGVIRGVQLVTRAKKTDSGAAEFRANLRSGLTGNAVQTGDSKVLTTDYVFYLQTFHVDPQSGLPFTIAGVNAIEGQIETTV